MKRLFILASAAALMLASCAKTTVVYNEAPEEIGFKAVTGVMTKAGVQTLGENTTMGVFANLTSDKGMYFGNTSFGPVEVTPGNYEWVANPKKYWPLGDGTLDFAVYAPFNNETGVVNWSYDNSNTKLSIKVSNGGQNQTDWLYGKTFYNNVSKTNIAKEVVLRHALAKLIVNVSSDLQNLEITSLTIKNTEQNETMTIDYAGAGKDDNDYTDGDGRVTWTNDNASVDKILISNYTFSNIAESKNAECYVIPSDQTVIELKYKLYAEDTEKTYEHSLSGAGAKWYGGYKYTYIIDIAANEIKFSPSVDDWEEGEGVEADINPNIPNNN